jgi:LemA protein
MNKNTIILLAVVGILVLTVFWGIGKFNGLVNKDEAVKAEWSKVGSEYQRRSDLIPNLVNTVKGYASHESETLEGVVAARAKATQISVSSDNLSPEKLKQYQAAQGEVSSALGRLMMISENYPDLKANENFKELQAQLEGTENRINVARKNFIDLSKEFNTSIRKFPTSIIASIGGFEMKTYFEATDNADQNPIVDFGKK